MPERFDLFASATSEARLHPNFRALRDSPDHGDARAFMNALFARSGDPNGNFHRDFQTNGFHSRLFELACFAYLDAAGFTIDRRYAQPDFVASRDGKSVALEAVAANPPEGSNPDISVRHLKDIPHEELKRKIYEEFPQRLLAVLQKKLKHRYHKLPHCAGLPLVFAVAPYFEAGSVFFSDEVLLPCLYRYSETPVPRFLVTPFFHLPHAESVSAVLYCNQFTVPRFLRLAPQTENRRRLRLIRRGECFIDRPDDQFVLADYEYEVGDPQAPEETWHQGVTIFHNPYAAVPLSHDLLPCTSRFHVNDDGLRRDLYGFHPATSMMWMFDEKPDEQKAG